MICGIYSILALRADRCCVGLYRLVEEFGRRAQACAASDDLFALTEAAVREIRFQRVALVHGLWFRRPSRRLIRLDNFGEWADIFIERRGAVSLTATSLRYA